MADTPKTVAEALQEAIRSCDVKRDHNYRMGADSFTITTAEYAALRALSTQVAQRDEARELMRKVLRWLDATDSHGFLSLTPEMRESYVERIEVFLQREGAQKAEGQVARLPQTASSAREAGESADPGIGTQTAPAPSTPDMERDAARWNAAVRLGWPEYCPHWEGAPRGDGWYHALTGERRFDTANAAIDAAIDAAMHKDKGGKV